MSNSYKSISDNKANLIRLNKNGHDFFINSDKNNDICEQTQIQTYIYRESRKCFPSWLLLQKLDFIDGKSTIQNLKEITYTIDNNRDVLYNVYLYITTPEIKIKDNSENIRFRFINNLPIETVQTINFEIDDVRVQSFDNYYLNNYYQWELNCDEKKAFNKECNSDEFLNWSSTSIDSYKMKFFIPFYFTKDTSVCFPMFFDKTKKYKIRGEFRNKLHDLLIIEKETNGQFLPICKSEFHKYFDNENIETLIYGYYGDHTDEEKKIIAEEINEGKRKLSTYYFDYTTTLSSNPMKIGSTLDLLFPNRTNISHFYFGILNCDSLKYNIYSNFTTSLYNKNGKNPISMVILKTDINIREFTLEPEHFINKLPFLEGFPDKKGFHMWTNAIEISEMDSSVYLYYENQVPTLTCELIKLEDNNYDYKMYILTAIKKCIIHDFSSGTCEIKIV